MVFNATFNNISVISWRLDVFYISPSCLKTNNKLHQNSMEIQCIHVMKFFFECRNYGTFPQKKKNKELHPVQHDMTVESQQGFPTAPVLLQ